MKKMDVTKKKIDHRKKIVYQPTDKYNKNIYILGASMVKHVEGWKLKKSIDKNHNVYVRSFTGAKLKCMKEKMYSCLKKKPDYVIFHVGTNELNSGLLPKRIAESIMYVAKNTQLDSRIVGIFDILSRNETLS